jgi:hypothetical protein
LRFGSAFDSSVGRDSIGHDPISKGDPMTALRHSAFLTVALLIPVFVSGCASDGGPLTTNSVTGPENVALVAPKPDPACVTLTSQIDTLRKEGTVARLEAAASGKSASVPVLRAALKKQSELNKANADFQAKCSKVPSGAPQSAQAPAAPAAAVVAAATPGLATKAVSKAAVSGVTSAAPTTGGAAAAAAAAKAAAKVQ